MIASTSVACETLDVSLPFSLPFALHATPLAIVFVVQLLRVAY